jgi:dihydropteroate synthase
VRADPRFRDLGDGATRLMGVLNVTPDSFSDGGRFAAPADAVAHGLRMVEEGATIIDVGGESTRPGYVRVPPQEQNARVLPVVAGLRARTRALISVDTTRAAVAAAALDAGADLVNDTSALLEDRDLGPLLARRGVPVILMHRFDPPRAAGDSSDPVAAVAGGLRARAAAAMECGIVADAILVDPGIGFGTLATDNPALIARIDEVRGLGFPVVVGPSRKSFLGHLTGRPPSERSFGTAAAVAALALSGVEVIRVHDVAHMQEVLKVAAAVRAARGRPATALEGDT